MECMSGQGMMTTTASCLPRADAGQPDGHHHRSGVNTAVLICDIHPAMLYPWSALAQEADRHLRSASCLAEASPSLPGTCCVSQCCQAPGGYRDSTWRLQGVVQHWLKDYSSSRRFWRHFLFFSLNTNTWISPCARHDCSWDNSQHLCQGRY